jgi:hypothetical protein
MEVTGTVIVIFIEHLLDDTTTRKQPKCFLYLIGVHWKSCFTFLVIFLLDRVFSHMYMDFGTCPSFTVDCMNMGAEETISLQLTSLSLSVHVLYYSRDGFNGSKKAIILCMFSPVYFRLFNQTPLSKICIACNGLNGSGRKYWMHTGL